MLVLFLYAFVCFFVGCVVDHVVLNVFVPISLRLFRVSVLATVVVITQ